MNRTQRLSTEEALPATRAIPRSPEPCSSIDDFAMGSVLINAAGSRYAGVEARPEFQDTGRLAVTDLQDSDLGLHSG